MLQLNLRALQMRNPTECKQTNWTKKEHKLRMVSVVFLCKFDLGCKQCIINVFIIELWMWKFGENVNVFLWTHVYRNLYCACYVMNLFRLSSRVQQQNNAYTHTHKHKHTKNWRTKEWKITFQIKLNEKGKLFCSASSWVDKNLVDKTVNDKYKKKT